MLFLKPPRLKIIRLILILSAAGPLELRAQPAAIEQIQNSRLQQSPGFPAFASVTNAPELYQGESTDVGPQRILRLVPRPRYLNVLFDSQAFYTDNANFAPTRQKLGSTVFVNTFQAALTPPELPLGDGKIISTLGVASQWYNYENDQMRRLDFDAQTVFLGGKYLVGKWLLTFDTSYTRLVDQPNYHLTYQEFLPALTLQHFFPITDSLLVTLGNQFDYHFTDRPATLGTYPDINNRLDNIVSLTVSWKITRHLVLQPSYRFMFSNYHYNTLQNADRNDYLNSAGVSLVYTFNENFSIRTFFNYNAKCSDDPYAAAYHELNGGAGVALNLLF